MPTQAHPPGPFHIRRRLTVNNPIKLILLFLPVLLLLAAGGYFLASRYAAPGTTQVDMSDAPTYRSGPFRVAVSHSPAAPQVGENRLSLRITDSAGEPVEGAQIQAYGEMPAMGVMAAMRAPVTFKETEAGMYDGEFELAMGGEWPLSLTISKSGIGDTRLGFDMATGRPGLQLSSGGSMLQNAMSESEDMTMTGGMSSTASPPKPDSEGYYSTGKYRLQAKIMAREPADEPDMSMDMDMEGMPMDSMQGSGMFMPGENLLQVRVQDVDGNPVSDAQVRAVAQLLDDEGQPVEHTPVAQLEAAESGVYRGVLVIEKQGEYSLAIDVATEKLGHGDLILGFSTGKTGLAAMTATPEGISHYTCSMHPSVKEAGPGNCPICGMDLVPVSKEEVATGTITVDNRRRQMIGVKTAQATHRDMTKVIRAVGKVDYDERRISNVSLKFDAWIGELKADYVGAPVKRGQILFTVYSPELLAAQQEYLETRQRLARRGPDDSLLKAARQRLMLWDISPAQVRLLEERGKALQYLPIFAPNSGTVVEKNVVEGSHMMTGSTLLRIADLSRVWVDAEVYEGDLPYISEGMPATVTLPYLPDEAFQASVDYVYPYLEGKTRTARIRLVLDNPDGRLKPDMYAEVKLQSDLGHRLAVPEEAVLVAGESRVVFVDLGEGKLRPTRVKTGTTVDGWTVIREGLELRDTVVTSGNFLIAAEAKLKTGIDQW